MLPREHGAYFQLAIPLVAAAFSQPPRFAGASIMIAACLAFLAHEPLLILVGARGPRLRASDGGRARARFAALAGGAVAAGGVGLALAPAAALPVAALAAAAGAAVVALAVRRSEHTLGGELIAAVALTGASGVALAAGGAAVDAAMLRWLGWAVGFAATVVAVHRVLARHKHRATAVDRRSSIAGGRAPRGIDRALAVGFAAAAAALIATAPRCATSAIAAPLVALAAGVIAVPPPATRLRALGIAVVATAAVSAALGAVAA